MDFECAYISLLWLKSTAYTISSSPSLTIFQMVPPIICPAGRGVMESPCPFPVRKVKRLKRKTRIKTLLCRLHKSRCLPSCDGLQETHLSNWQSESISAAGFYQKHCPHHRVWRVWNLRYCFETMWMEGKKIWEGSGILAKMKEKKNSL